jgi:hypothetical protein
MITSFQNRLHLLLILDDIICILEEKIYMLLVLFFNVSAAPKAFKTVSGYIPGRVDVLFSFAGK